MLGIVQDDDTAPAYISTGALPPADLVSALVAEAHKRFRSNRDGENSDVYPALARAQKELFGVFMVDTSGNVYAAGDAQHEFSIMSVSKPFLFALVCQEIGPSEARNRLGANSTGLPFNSLSAVKRTSDGRTNPMVNAGAISTTSLVPGASTADKWQFIHRGLSQFAGRTLRLNEEVCVSASETNFRNRSIANLLQSYNRIYCDPAEATDLYTRQCSLNVSAKDLAVMGATLADGGVNPLTKERVVHPIICHYALAVMATAGLYETSGDWLYDIGLPGKSGIGATCSVVATERCRAVGNDAASFASWFCASAEGHRIEMRGKEKSRARVCARQIDPQIAGLCRHGNLLVHRVEANCRLRHAHRIKLLGHGLRDRGLLARNSFHRQQPHQARLSGRHIYEGRRILHVWLSFRCSLRDHLSPQGMPSTCHAAKSMVQRIMIHAT